MWDNVRVYAYEYYIVAPDSSAYVYEHKQKYIRAVRILYISFSKMNVMNCEFQISAFLHTNRRIRIQ